VSLASKHLMSLANNPKGEPSKYLDDEPSKYRSPPP